VIDVL